MSVEFGGLRCADIASVGTGKISQVGLFIAGQTADVLYLVDSSQFILLELGR